MRKARWMLAAAAIAIAAGLMITTNSRCADDNISDLKKEIETLRTEIADLKARQRMGAPKAAQRRASGHAWPYDMYDAWDPFAEMQQMQDRMNRLFRESFSRSNAMLGTSLPALGSFYEPDLDIQDKKDHYLMVLDLPGMQKDQIHVEATEHDIVISGQRDHRSESQDDGKGFYRVERRFGSFSRRLPLPDDAATEGINARYEKGVLEIKIPKKETVKGKKYSKPVNIS